MVVVAVVGAVEEFYAFYETKTTIWGDRRTGATVPPVTCSGNGVMNLHKNAPLFAPF